MKDEERGELKEDEEDSDEKNRPLSREGWIMLLSGEINKEEMKLFLLENHGNVILLTLFLGGVAAVIAIVQIGMVQDVLTNIILQRTALCYFILIFEGLMITFALYNWFYRYPRVQKRLKRLINIREPIISGELTDFSEIRKEWKEYIKKYYRKLLEKSELDEEEKELNEGKEKSEKKNLEQKEVLQVPQSDIRDIKESLRRIEDINEVSLFSSEWRIFGSLCIAIGFAMIGIRVSLGYTNPSEIEKAMIFSFLLIFAGAFMISGTYIAGKNVNLYKKPWKNKLLFLGILSLVCAGLVLIAL